MKRHDTIKTIAYGTVLAGLLGFSTAGLAQSKAIESLNHSHGLNNSAAAVESHPQVNQLATALDEFNEQDRIGRGPETHVPTNAKPQHVTRQARQLATEIDAYYANADDDRVPHTRVFANEINQPIEPVTQRLAAELTTYNRTGGSQRY